MLAAPPDRIRYLYVLIVIIKHNENYASDCTDCTQFIPYCCGRGWAALLAGFDVAKDPSLFGKMLKRAPFMFYVNPPRIGDDDLSHVVDSDVSATASGFVAYGALSVLHLLRAQNFPDLDKLVRTQPSILLVDTSEVKSRAEFLVNLFLENMPSIADATAQHNDPKNSDNGLDRDLTQAVAASRDFARPSAKVAKKPKSAFATSQVVYATQETDLKKLSVNGKVSQEFSEVSVDEKVSNQHLAHDMLGALLLTYPAVLAIDHS